MSAMSQRRLCSTLYRDGVTFLWVAVVVYVDALAERDALRDIERKPGQVWPVNAR